MAISPTMLVQVRTPDGWRFTDRKAFPLIGDPDYERDNDPLNWGWALLRLIGGVAPLMLPTLGRAPGERCLPLFAGRGLPDGVDEWDCAPKVQERATWAPGSRGLGELGQTHASLAELRTLPWGLEVELEGVVSPSGFRSWVEGAAPLMWSLSVEGLGVNVCEDPDTFRAMLEGGGDVAHDGESYTHCRVRWQERPIEAHPFRAWLDGDVMEALEAEGGGPDGVRVLFGFG